MTFLPNIPNASDLLAISQVQLKTNNQALDSVYGGDHYAFSDATPNATFHKKVTTPSYPSGPPTTTINPILYAFSVGNTGIVQFSRGPSDAAPTPITHLQSPTTPITLLDSATTDVFDFTGLTLFSGVIYAFDSSDPATIYICSGIVWKGSAPVVQLKLINTVFNKIQTTASGNKLQIQNTSGGTLSNIYWTLQMDRIA